MDFNSKIKLKYRFEKVPVNNRPLSNPIERFGMLASQVVQSSPSLIPYLNFGRAEKISDGILDPGLIAPQQMIESQSEHVRIRCIEDATGPLVEYHYNNDGYIHEVILLNSFCEKYQWTDDGKLLSVSSPKNEITEFKYQKDGLLASINYPNGSIFRYEYDNQLRLSAITYPDGLTNKYFRNDVGLLIRSEFQDGTFDFLWDENNLMNEILYKDKLGTWNLKVKEFNNRTPLRFSKSSSSSSQSISSILGNWRYDKNGILFEMIVPGGQRFKKRGDEESGIELWTHNGQTFYNFDKSKVLMSIVNNDGTNTIFRRNIAEKFVMLVSVMGITILNYDKQGVLFAEREQQFDAISYKYNRQKTLNRISTDEKIINLNWTKDGKIKRINIDGSLNCSIKHLLGIPDQISIKTCETEVMECAEMVIHIIWNWEAMRLVRRLDDISFKN
mgnify:CR=1 FL=1|jgi:YD repeat-containing protein